MAPDIDVTVAAIIENDGRFLVVEEVAGGQIVLNQPAGHVESDESLLAAVVRETREETGFEFQATNVVGIYLWRNDGNGATFLRTTFCGRAKPPIGSPKLDEGILGVHWLTRSQLLGRERDLRSPMVLRCIDDYLAGARYTLDCLTHLAPTQMRARHARG
jgi:8-oxo-dGTP pyrophosphatase MutT (NUDIX family)